MALPIMLSTPKGPYQSTSQVYASDYNGDVYSNNPNIWLTELYSFIVNPTTPKLSLSTSPICELFAHILSSTYSLIVFL